MDEQVQAYGCPYPFGATRNAATPGYNFTIWSKAATRVTLLLFQKDSPYGAVYQYQLDPIHNKTGAIWHCFVSLEQAGQADCYAYRIDGPIAPGNCFNYNKLLLDPWAREVFFPPNYSRAGMIDKNDNTGTAPLGVLPRADRPLPMEEPLPQRCRDNELIIYELHLKGFTHHPSSGVAEAHRGTFAGVIDKIPYLKELGVTAVELMPIHQFDPQEGNYWGYMTMNFFAPHHSYSSDKTEGDPTAEFRAMVRALHHAEIAVILDVVYNHTAEEDEHGPFFSYKGINNAAYYLLSPDLSTYNDDAGTRNVLRTAHPIVRQLMLDSLRYWASLGVDGFRFDLASLFTRNGDGSINTSNPAIIEEISMDPLLGRLRLIAEPWDIGAFQLGTAFPAPHWG